MQRLNYIWKTEHLCEVTTMQGMPLGELYREIDGDFYYYPPTNGGFWASWFLHELADKLDSLNKDNDASP